MRPARGDDCRSEDGRLGGWDPQRHAPCVGLINPKSGGRRGASVLEACRKTDYFCDRVFSALDVIDGSQLGAFRQRLDEAKGRAQASLHPGCRPRLVCGGGDGTASLALYLVFRALLDDQGSWFRWTDEELRLYFPALVQLPLGTGNDLAGVLGWGRRAPSQPGAPGACCAAPGAGCLARWFDEALDLATPVLDFDVWGFMPPSGSTSLDMKLCEVQSVELKADAPDYIMKPPGPAVPFLMLLYGSFGFSAHVVARFELQRTTHRWSNFLVYTRVAASLLLGLGRPPRQLLRNLEGLTADIVPERGKPGPYLPPRPSVESQRYLEVGFLNLWSTRGGLVRGVERAGCASRWCCRGTLGGPGRRRAADFGDGVADFYRERGLRTWAKTGTRLQTDRASRGTFRFDAPGGKGVFLQFDGEGRFAFHPGGKAWAVDVRHVLTVPVAVHPSVRASTGAPSSAGFRFVGAPEEVEAAKARIRSWVRGHLIDELNATPEDIKRAGLPLAEDTGSPRKPARLRGGLARLPTLKKGKNPMKELWAADTNARFSMEGMEVVRAQSTPKLKPRDWPLGEMRRRYARSNSAPVASSMTTAGAAAPPGRVARGAWRLPGCGVAASLLGQCCSALCARGCA